MSNLLNDLSSYSDDELVRELIRNTERFSNSELDRSRARLVENEFKERFQETIAQAAWKAHSYYRGTNGVNLNHAWSPVLEHLNGDSSETAWDTLQQYQPGNFRGWLYRVSFRRLRNYALREVGNQIATEPLPEDELARRQIDSNPGFYEDESSNRLHGSYQSDVQMDLKRAVRATSQLISSESASEAEGSNSGDTLELASHLLYAIIEEEYDHLGKSQSGIPYAEVLLEVEQQKGNKTDLYDTFYQELQERLNEDELPDRNTLKAWAMRGQRNLRAVLVDKYPDSAEVLLDFLFGPQ